MKAFKKPVGFVVDKSIIKESALTNLLKELAEDWSIYDYNYNEDEDLSELAVSEGFLLATLRVLDIMEVISLQSRMALEYWMFRTSISPDEPPFTSSAYYYYEAGEDIAAPADRRQFMLDALCDIFEVSRVTFN